MYFEKQLADIYQALATNYHSKKTAQAFWKKLYLEEIQHYRHLESELNFLKNNPNFYQIPDIQIASLENFSKIIDSVSGILKDPLMEIESVFIALNDLELMLMQIHIELEAQVSDKKLRDLFKFLSNKDKKILKELDLNFKNFVEIPKSISIAA